MGNCYSILGWGLGYKVRHEEVDPHNNTYSSPRIGFKNGYPSFGYLDLGVSYQGLLWWVVSASVPHTDVAPGSPHKRDLI